MQSYGYRHEKIETMNLKLAARQRNSASDVSSHARVAVIDEAYAFATYRRTNIVGKTIRLYMEDSWENYEIVGIIASQTETLNTIVGGNIGAFIYVPYTSMNEVTDESGSRSDCHTL